VESALSRVGADTVFASRQKGEGVLPVFGLLQYLKNACKLIETLLAVSDQVYVEVYFMIG
jgi:hypothetical protein